MFGWPSPRFKAAHSAGLWVTFPGETPRSHWTSRKTGVGCVQPLGVEDWVTPAWPGSPG